MAELSEQIRVLIVDDDALVRAGLTMLLAGAHGIQIVGETADGSEAEHAITQHQPDVVLMDIRMPGMDGLAATEILRARDHPPEVIVLTTFDTDDHILSALRAGASGFLLKDTPPADIVRAIRAVAAGEPILSPSITRRLIDHATGGEGGQRRRHARDQLGLLSEREREVAVAIGCGKSNAEISRELYMSIATVKAHVSRLLEKLEFNNRVQIALLAHDAGEASLAADLPVAGPFNAVGYPTGPSCRAPRARRTQMSCLRQPEQNCKKRNATSDVLHRS